MKNEVHKFSTAYKMESYFFYKITYKIPLFTNNELITLISFRHEIDKIFSREPI